MILYMHNDDVTTAYSWGVDMWYHVVSSVQSTGAPTSHNKHLGEKENEVYEQWPYQIQLSGTSPCATVLTIPEN